MGSINIRFVESVFQIHGLDQTRSGLDTQNSGKCIITNLFNPLLLSDFFQRFDSEFIQIQSIMKNFIKVERAKLNITQEELANQLKVSRQSINAIETGKFVPSTILALKMAKYFQISIHEIFQLEIND